MKDKTMHTYAQPHASPLHPPRVSRSAFERALLLAAAFAVHGLQAVGESLALAARRRRERIQAQRDRAALLAMPEHELRDIGIARRTIIETLDGLIDESERELRSGRIDPEARRAARFD